MNTEVRKYRVLDEFTMYEGDDWNKGKTTPSEGEWVKAKDHDAIVAKLLAALAATKK